MYGMFRYQTEMPTLRRIKLQIAKIQYAFFIYLSNSSFLNIFCNVTGKFLPEPKY